jgi:hypothetical protein
LRSEERKKKKKKKKILNVFYLNIFQFLWIRPRLSYVSGLGQIIVFFFFLKCVKGVPEMVHHVFLDYHFLGLVSFPFMSDFLIYPPYFPAKVLQLLLSTKAKV